MNLISLLDLNNSAHVASLRTMDTRKRVENGGTREGQQEDRAEDSLRSKLSVCVLTCLNKLSVRVFA